jgi:filamentous hemagglutinin family protein
MNPDTSTGHRPRAHSPCCAKPSRKHSTWIMYRAGSASAAVLFAVLGTAHALPLNGQVVAGTGTVAVAQAAGTMTVTQTSPKLVINWASFNTASGEKVNFVQQGTSSIVLNRVSGQSHTPTSFLGTLNAIGQVFVVDPSGILFGAGSHVNVGGLVASSHPISDADFLAGTYRFIGSGGGGAVINQGSIAADGGYVTLIGPQVVNGGSITANGGTALLAAGDKVTLQINGSSLLGYTIDRGALSAAVVNQLSGSIRADGGKVILSAQAMNGTAAAVVNNDGVIEAHTINQSGGVIQLLGDMAVGVLVQNGKLDASAPSGGNGGSIDLSARIVRIADVAQITTRSLSGPGSSGKFTATAASDFVLGSGPIQNSNLSAAVLQTALDNNASITIATTVPGTGGSADITVASPVNWTANTALNLIADRNVNLNATTQSTGGGKLLLRADSGGKGIGTVSIDPGVAPVMTGGQVDIYYNPTNFTAPVNFAPLVAGNATAWMLVNDLAHLQALNSNLSGNYALGRDIDASASSITPFIPVGSFNGTAYSGNFDGLSHIISNLNVSSADSAVGLFGYINGATISNVGLAGGSVKATTGIAGGLAGFSALSTISNAFNTGTVDGTSAAGGLVGVASQTNIRDAYASGPVTSSTGPAGGLIAATAASTISGSYSSGAVSGSISSGLVGRFDPGNTTAQNNYWYSSTPVLGSNRAGITKLDTVAQLKDPNSFVGFDFNSTWRQYDGFGAPLLKSFLKPLTITLSDTTKSYDGLASAVVQFTLSDPAATVSGTGLVFQPPPQIIRNAGVYTFIPNAWSNQENGFDISYAGGKKSATIEVVQAPLTVTAVSATKTYDGTTVSTTKPTVTGLQQNDTVNASESYDSRNAGTRTLTASVASISDGNGGNNYTLQNVTAVGTILQAPLTVTAVSATKVYDGTVGSTTKPTVAGLQQNDTANARESYDSRNAGTRTLTASVASISDGNGGNNYTIRNVGVGGTIVRAPLTVTAVSDTKAFDGTTISGKTPLVTGLMPGDALSSNVETFDTASIGTRILAAATVVNDGNGGANYAISASPAAGQILSGQAVLNGLLAGPQNPSALIVAAALLTDPASRQAAARSNAQDGTGATNPANVLAQFNDDALYSSESVQARLSTQEGRTGRHTFSVEGSGIRLPEGVE